MAVSLLQVQTIVAASLKQGESAFLCDRGARQAQLLEGPILLDCLLAATATLPFGGSLLKGLYNLSLGLCESDDVIAA